MKQNMQDELDVVEEKKAASVIESSEELEDDFDIFKESQNVEDDFVALEARDLVYGTWAKGHNTAENPDGSEEIAKGLIFDRSKCPPDFNTAMEAAAKAKKARLISVTHESGAIVDYWQFAANVRFFPLITGIAKTSDISSGKAPVQGVGHGWWTEPLRDRESKLYTGEYVHGTFCTVQVIAEAIADSYVDDRGLPKPIALHFRSYAAGELLSNVLAPHSALTTFARNKKYMVSTLDPSPYMFGFTWNTKEKKKHGKGEEAKQCVIVNSNTPSGKDLSLDYIKSMQAPNPLIQKMSRLLYVKARINGNLRTVTGGKVMDWCKERIDASLKNQATWNPGDVLKVKGPGKFPCPGWMKRIMDGDAIDMSAVNGSSPNGGVDFKKMSKEAYIKQARDLVQANGLSDDIKFALREVADGLEANTYTLDDAREVIGQALRERQGKSVSGFGGGDDENFKEKVEPPF